MIVNKPWGHEVRWAVNEKYLGKILKIEPGMKLSRQYHEVKDDNVRIIMKPGSSRRIEPGTIHRFCAPSEGCTLVEVSTPEIDDVVRIQDDYGRN